MQRYGWTLALPVLIALVILAGCSQQEQNQDGANGSAEISGRIDGGLRVLTIDPAAQDQRFSIYRGDYVRLESSGGGAFTVEIPALEVSKRFPVAQDDKPYFKVPEAGSYPFVAGDASGVIEAVDYRAAAYREVTARQAAEFIENLDPVILDVRTRREYTSGHLPDARLVPIGTLQNEVSELAGHRNDPVLVYCRTGNRSTVAAKILVDHGFTNVVNLRRGIVEWQREGLATER